MFVSSGVVEWTLMVSRYPNALRLWNGVRGGVDTYGQVNEDGQKVLVWCSCKIKRYTTNPHAVSQVDRPKTENQRSQRQLRYLDRVSLMRTRCKCCDETKHTRKAVRQWTRARDGRTQSNTAAKATHTVHTRDPATTAAATRRDDSAGRTK